MVEFIAIALALALGLTVGWFGGITFTAREIGKAVRREIDAGHLDLETAQRIGNVRS